MSYPAILLSLLIVALAWAAMIPVCGIHRLGRPTMLGMAFLASMAAQYLPACVFLFDPTMPKAQSFFWSTTLSLALMPIGGAFANLMFRFSRRELDAFIPTAAATPPLPRDRLMILAYIMFLLVVFGLYVSEVKTYPFALLLRGGTDSHTLNMMRREVLGPEMGSRIWYLYAITRAALMPMLFMLVLSGWSTLRGGLQQGMGALLVVVAFVFNSWSGAKTPVAMLFLLAAFLFVLRSGARTPPSGARSALPPRRRLRRILSIAIPAALVVAYPVLVFSRKNFGQTHTLLEVLYQGVFKRIFFSPALLSYYQFEMFPDLYPFTHFMDIGKLAQLLGEPQVYLSTLTMMHATGQASGNAPPAAIGNFYSEWGWPMVAIGSLAVGFVFQAMQVWFVRQTPRNVLALGLQALLLWGGFRICMNGFHDIFLTEGIVPTLGFVVFWRLWRAGAGTPVQAATTLAGGPG